MSDDAELAHLRTYLREVEHAYRVGTATEHSYRPALKTLLERLAPKVTATNEPKRIACGAPDYALTRADPSGPRTIGYIEAKDIGVSLDEMLRTDQLKRYFASLDNLILTDYLEFRWYVRRDSQMEHRKTARIATLGPNRTLMYDPQGTANVADMLVGILGMGAQVIRSPKDLAERMARMAHMIRNVVLETLRSGEAQVGEAWRTLTDLHKRVQDALIPAQPADQFADMFAQTVVYGLFAARINFKGHKEDFRWQVAARAIPRSNPFLRRLFELMTSTAFEEAPFIGFVDDLAQILADADMAAILRDFGKRTRTDDPVVHFYETFLLAYDPKLRELRGVYYTPEPVVSYIVRSVDAILRRDFNLANGLATTHTASVGGALQQPLLLLDPACGTGTFLYGVVSLIRERFRASNNAGAWSGYVRDHLLPRLHGFELLMASYSMAHLKLGMELAALDMDEAERAGWRYDLDTGEQRLRVYLTNTLEEAALNSDRLPESGFIVEEADAASAVKRENPVMVVLGNPPYSGHSANKGEWIERLLHGEDLTRTRGTGKEGRGKGDPTENYFMVDGQPLGERNPKWLNDDYVKFIRFAQWRIERTGHGVLAFVTNHGYLDNPTFRGMRQSLMRTFDDIYVLDLHGNSNKKERTPEGGKDENVFDIQQGVAIGMFIRRRGASTGDRHATVRHAHLWGEREAKYDWLTEQGVASTGWTELTPQSPSYLFTPRDERLAEEYETGWNLKDMMTVKSVGIVTARDDLTIHMTVEGIWHTVTDFINRVPEDARTHYNLGPDAQDWQVVLAQADVKKSGPTQSKIRPIVYRPFDVRHTYYTGTSRGFQCRPRPEVMSHMLAGPNLGLITTGQTRDEWDALATNHIIGHKALAAYDINSLFPLYLYPDTAKSSLWDAEQVPSSAPGGRRANMSPEFIRDFSERLELTWVADGRGDRVATFGPEDVFSYLYAILHAPSYRERYAAFLKSDFPRAPLTRDANLFRALCGLGDRLVALHLMEATAPGQPSFPIGGDNRVEAVRYLEPDAAQGRAGRVYINQAQYFEGITPEVWWFHIGGYQVAEKWPKDRKGRMLTYDDIEHYANTVAALAETARLMEQIDEVIEDHGGWPLNAADVSDASA